MHTHEIWTLNDTTEPVMMIETDGGRFICRAHRKHAPLIVRAVNAHATLVAALELVAKSGEFQCFNDAAWDAVNAALDLAKHGSSQVEQPQ